MQAERYRPWGSVLATFLLVGLLGFLLLPSVPAPHLADLRYPAESAGRMVERHLEFYEGYETTPNWQKAVFSFLFGQRHEVEGEAIAVYREVLGYLESEPDAATPWAVLNTRARLLITLAETGRWQELEQELQDFGDMPDEGAIVDALRYAYTDGPAHPIPPHVSTGASLLPLGWASDRLRLAIASKAGHPRLQSIYQGRLEAHGSRWRVNTLLLVALIAAAVTTGLFVLWKKRALLTWPSQSRGVLAQPWRMSEGFAVAVWAALWGILISLGLGMWAGSYFKPGLLALWSTLFASVPMLWLLHTRLLRPRGHTFVSAFGLNLRAIGVSRFIAATLVVLAIDWAGTLAITWTGWQLGLSAHWSEGLQERMIFGPLQSTVLGSINMVLWAPLLEEIGFRGLVYVSLRSRLRPLPAALISAGLFSSLHLYSLPGFLSVFWSGLVLAFAFERFRSLLPGIAVHMAGNTLALSTVLLFYR